MTSALSLILAFMLTMGGSPAVSVSPGSPGGAIRPVNSIGSESGVSTNITEKPRLGKFLKIYPVGTIPNVQNARLVLNLRFHYKKSPLMNLYQGFNMNPVNFTDPMGEHTFKNINLFGQEIEVAAPDLDEIHSGHYAMRFSYEYKGKIQNVIVDQHMGKEWAFQAKLGNPILKPLWEAFYGVSTSEIKESAFKLWSKSLAHHSPEIVMSALGSIAYMAEANAARNIINTNKIIKINKAGRFYDARTGRFIKTKEVIGTETDKAFFWSGRTKGVGGEKVAGNIAEKYKGTTLEKLVEQKEIKMPEWNPNDPNSIRAWENLSREYAKNASGTVRAVVGESTRPGSVWETIELPELMKNPKVTKIIIIDPATGKETVIFAR